MTELDLLTNLQQVKAMLGLPACDTNEDFALNFYISAASAAILNFTNRTHWLASNPINPITSYLSGSGDQWLILPQWPVVSVTSINLDDGAYWGQGYQAWASNTLLTPGTDYAVVIDDASGMSRKAMVLMINNVWDTQWNRDGDMLASYPTSGQGNIRVVANYGFDSVPLDVQMAATMIVSRMRAEASTGNPLASQSLGQFSQSFSVTDNTALGLVGGNTALLLAKYRIQPFGVFV